ncbi:MAG TPA: FlgD immunoglobulin-like domain containing protein [Candidatus Krumholzibacteria bacterium]|nr:FlgD immunoglobulin-like domain containing protein [Candidatus Krumholzibacteria bacterium]
MRMRLTRAALAAAALAAVALAAPAAAQNCVDYAMQVQVVGREPTPAVALVDLVVVGTHVYAAGFMEAGLEILDIADPVQPTVVATTGDPSGSSPAWSIAVDGGLACVGGDTALYVFDVADSAAPVLLGVAPLDAVAWSVEARGGVAWVMASGDSLLVFDLGEPTAPARIGALGGVPVASNGFGDTSVLAGDRLFVVGDAGVTIVDVATPSAPTVAGVVPMVAYGAAGVAVAGDLLYAVTRWNATLHIVDVAVPGAPLVLADLVLPRSGETVVVDGGRVYVAGCCGVEIIDVTTPSAPVYLGNVLIAPDTYGAAASDGFLYLATLSGLRVCDLTYPDAAAAPAVVPLPRAARDLAAAPGLIYVADLSSGLRILDAASPDGPAEVGAYADGSYAVGVAARGSLVYVADSTRGLDVVDVRDPAVPQRIGNLQLGGGAVSVVAVGDLAYVTTPQMNLTVVDVSIPAAPAVVGTLGAGLSGGAVAVAGDLAFVVGGAGGLRIVDVADPAAPALVGSIVPGTFLRDVAVAGGIAYAADMAGLYVLDVHDPVAPEVLAFRPTEGIGEAVAVVEDRVCLVTLDDVIVFDVADPGNPIPIGALRISSGGRDVLVGDRIHVATSLGLESAPLQCTDSVASTIGGGGEPSAEVPPVTFALDVRPNPFNPRAEIGFALDRPEAVRVTIHDLRGRLVRVVADGRLAAGPHRLIWDGRDASGRAAGAGVYMVHLATARSVLSRKLTLLR